MTSRFAEATAKDVILLHVKPYSMTSPDACLGGAITWRDRPLPRCDISQVTAD